MLAGARPATMSQKTQDVDSIVGHSNAVMRTPWRFQCSGVWVGAKSTPALKMRDDLVAALSIALGGHARQCAPLEQQRRGAARAVRRRALESITQLFDLYRQSLRLQVGRAVDAQHQFGFEQRVATRRRGVLDAFDVVEARVR